MNALAPYEPWKAGAPTSGAGRDSRDLATLIASLSEQKPSYKPISTVKTTAPLGERRPTPAVRTSSGYQVSAPLHSWDKVGADLESARKSKSLDEQLFESVSAFKVLTSHISMHISREQRADLFAWMDDLFVVRDWDSDDTPTKIGSFKTFLRLLLLLKPEHQPSLAVTATGSIVAVWYLGEDRLSVVCDQDDQVRFVLTAKTDGERERASGDVKLARLANALAPYNPQRWFSFGKEAPGHLNT